MGDSNKNKDRRASLRRSCGFFPGTLGSLGSGSNRKFSVCRLAPDLHYSSLKFQVQSEYVSPREILRL